MAVGQPSRPRYQQPVSPHPARPGDLHLTTPPAAIPAGNVPVFVPRQFPDAPPSVSGGGDGFPGPSSDTQSFSQPPPTFTSESPNTSTDQPPSTEPPSTSNPPPTTLPSTTSSTTPPSMTSPWSTSSSSQPLSTSSSVSSITSPPSGTSGSLSSTSLTFSPETTISSAVVLTVNGHLTTSYLLIPTTLGDPSPNMSSSQRTAIIAGSVAGGVALTILVAAIFLFYRRHQNKKRGFFPSSESKPRAMLLSGEDLDDDYSYSRQTSNAPTPLPSSVRHTETPRLLRPRASETGSIFHEGGLWPPPSDGSKLVDPILAGSHINLSTIADDVIGNFAKQQSNPSGSNAAIRPRKRRSASGDISVAFSEGSIYSTDLPADPVPDPGHDCTSGHSETVLVPPEPLYLASTHSVGSSPSIPPSRRESGYDPSRSSISINNPHGTRNWLERSPRKISESPSNPFGRGPSPLMPDPGRYN